MTMQTKTSKAGKTPRETAANIAAGLRKEAPAATHALIGAALIYDDDLAVIVAIGCPGELALGVTVNFGTFAEPPPDDALTRAADTVLWVRGPNDVTMEEGLELRGHLIAELRQLSLTVEVFDSDLALAEATAALFPSERATRTLQALRAEMDDH